MHLKLISWNVNGLRAVLKKGFFEFVNTFSPDILCLQETRLSEDQIPVELGEVFPFSYWCHSTRKGYSGVSVFSAHEFQVINKVPGFDVEIDGRIILAKTPFDFTFVNVYIPNGRRSAERLAYKMRFYDAFLRCLKPMLYRGEKIVICGDINTAHKPIDLAHPEANQKTSGFLPEERAWIDTFLNEGFLDCFRIFDPSPQKYTWWDMRTGSRARDIGWRLDYFYASNNLKNSLISCRILKNVFGSDHCPVQLVIKV